MSSSETPMLSESGLVQDNAKMEDNLTPDSFIYSSITAILTGLDYIFYVWTILLIFVIAYLSIYKYYNTNKTKNKGNRQNSKKTNSILNFISLVVNILFNLVSAFLKRIIDILLNKDPRSVHRAKLDQKNFNQDNLLINNCLKWFYLNSETNKNINDTLLSLLNSRSFKHSVSHFNFNLKKLIIYFKI